MEILQTIWSVLTTESELITKIICIPLLFIEMYLSLLLFTNILNIKHSSHQDFLYVIFASTLGLFTIFIIPSPYNTIVNLIIHPIIIYVIFRPNILKSILAEIIPYIVFILTSLLIQKFCILTFNLSTEQIISIPIYKFVLSVLNYIIVYILTLIFIMKKVKISSTLKHNHILLINTLIGLLAIAIQYFILFSYIETISLGLLIVGMVTLLLYFFINIYSLSRTIQLEVTTEKLEEEKLYNKTLTVLYDKIRGFKHDFNNIVQGIGGYIATNNMDGLKEYYSQVLDDCQKVNNLALLSPEVINNPAIYSLLTAKYHDAAELGIKFNLEIFMDLSIINMKIYELTRILGILIDNAIEAASQCEEKEITITFRKDNKKNKQLFIIENTYMNKDVNIDEIFEKGKTSKKSEDVKSHGLGLWEVRQTVKRNKNLDLYTTKSEKYFKQQFEIYC